MSTSDSVIVSKPTLLHKYLEAIKYNDSLPTDFMYDFGMCS